MRNVIVIIIIIKVTSCLKCNEVLELPVTKKLKMFELQTMQPKEIVQCLSHLGSKRLTVYEAGFIWDSIVKYHNGVASIPKEVLLMLHHVTIAVRPEDYSNMTFNNIDVISKFGFYYGLTNEQLEAIARRVREDFGSKQPEDYTSHDLTALGQVLCAFNRSEIDKINPKAYKEAANCIGKLKNCNYEIMQGFADLATKGDAFGSPDLWTKAIVDDMGTVVNYLPEEIVSKLKVKLGGHFHSMDFKL